MSKTGGQSEHGGGFECLHAPWRLSYMELLASQERAGAHGDPPDTNRGGSAQPTPCCFLREYWLDPAGDEKNNVITRTGREDVNSGKGGMILLNRYPYSNGHLLVALGSGRMRLLDYSLEERAELWSLAELAVELTERTLHCQGVNVGINQGDAAGAGIPEHLHVHVVPRWAGDTNFMTTVGQIRVIPSALEAMYRRYTETWEQIQINLKG
jgi:ATP adenylyltransferase